MNRYLTKAVSTALKYSNFDRADKDTVANIRHWARLAAGQDSQLILGVFDLLKGMNTFLLFGDGTGGFNNGVMYKCSKVILEQWQQYPDSVIDDRQVSIHPDTCAFKQELSQTVQLMSIVLKKKAVRFPFKAISTHSAC